jgi:hypothetical protein
MPMVYDPVAQTISFTPRGTSDQSRSGEGTVHLQIMEK